MRKWNEVLVREEVKKFSTLTEWRTISNGSLKEAKRLGIYGELALPLRSKRKITHSEWKGVKPVVARMCPVCSSTFSDSVFKIYCSPECSLKRLPHAITCVYCQTKFMARSSRQKFCNLSCKGKYFAKEYLAKGYLRQSAPDEFSPFRAYRLRALRTTRIKKNSTARVVTLEELKDVFNSQRGRCAVSKIPLRIAPTSEEIIDKKNRLDLASLDRINSSLEYTKDNVRFVAMWVNFAKSNDQDDTNVIKIICAVATTKIDTKTAVFSEEDTKPTPGFSRFIHGKRRAVTVTPAYLLKQWRLQRGICPITGWKLRLSRNDPLLSASLDRIDSSLDYTPGNVRFISQRINVARSNATDSELKGLCCKAFDLISSVGPNSTVYLVTGVPGSGKSWVCKQLSGQFHYVSFDALQDQDRRLEELKKATFQPLPILFDPTVLVSGVQRKNPQFTWKLYVIQEDVNVIVDRLRGRGGKFTDAIYRRIKRMRTLAKKSEFTGTSDEVLAKLRGVCDDQAR